MSPTTEEDVAFADSPEALALLREFAHAVLTQLRDALSRHRWEPSRRRFVEFMDNGEWKYQEVVDSNYLLFFKQHLYDGLWDLPAAVEFARWSHARGGIRGLRTTTAYEMDFDHAKTFVIVDLLSPLLDYLRRGGPHDRVDDDLLISSWREIRTLGTQPKIHSCFLIEGLRIDNPVDLGRFGVLRPVSAQQKTIQFKHRWWERGPCPIDDAARCAVQLEPAQEDPVELNRAALVVLTALRLEEGATIFSRGPILTPISDRVPCAFGWRPLSDFAPPPRDHGDIHRATPNPFLLPSSSTERLRRTCTELHEVAMDRFRIAFRRFNQSFRRKDVDDRLVDLAIVLESTVLAGATAELFWRAQVLGAELLRSELKPATARDQIKALYDARSKIVHEGVVFAEAFFTYREWKKVAATAEAFDATMIELARKILVATTVRSRVVSSPEEFRKRLEEAVVLQVPFAVPPCGGRD
jgi:hypothetical protein